MLLSPDSSGGATTPKSSRKNTAASQAEQQILNASIQSNAEKFPQFYPPPGVVVETSNGQMAYEPPKDEYQKKIATSTLVNDNPPGTPVLQNMGVGPNGIPNFQYAPGVHLVSNKTLEMEQQATDQRAKEEKRRDKALGLGAAGPRDTMELTTEQYLGLSNDQRAAVDFNTLLATAVQQDLRRSRKVEDLDNDHYKDKVTEVFGETGGSDIYAPRTMSVLNKIGYEGAREMTDLDDFLSLKVAFTEKDLENVRPMEQAGPQFYGENATRLQQTRATLQQSLVNDLSESMSQYATTGPRTPGRPEADLQAFGTSPIAALQQQQLTGSKRGYGNTPEDATWWQAFDMMSDATLNDERRKDLMGRIATTLGEKDFGEFLSYADARSRTAATYGLPLGTTAENKYVDPAQFRKTYGFV